jgi:ribosomal protein L14E/L6E/L27E
MTPIRVVRRHRVNNNHLLSLQHVLPFDKVVFEETCLAKIDLKYLSLHW